MVAKAARSDLGSSHPPVGPYQLITPLGRGGMGTVYLARKVRGRGRGQTYALKLMHASLAREAEFVQMFRNEAEIASSVRHPNIVHVTDYGSDERGQHYVVMDYVEGVTLYTALARDPYPRPLGALLRVLLDVLSGLHGVHTAVGRDGRPLGIVHRDVSAANVLVGLDGVARLCDFGIAKAAESDAHTQTGVYKGRFSHGAPERFMDPDRVDARADVFSAGVMMWNALTGRELFRADSPGEMIHKILHAPVPPPSEGGLGSPRWLDSICLKALARAPEDRFGSAHEMALALAEAAARRGVVPSKAEAGEWVETHRAAGPDEQPSSQGGEEDETLPFYVVEGLDEARAGLADELEPDDTVPDQVVVDDTEAESRVRRRPPAAHQTPGGAHGTWRPFAQRFVSPVLWWVLALTLAAGAVLAAGSSRALLDVALRSSRLPRSARVVISTATPVTRVGLTPSQGPASGGQRAGAESVVVPIP